MENLNDCLGLEYECLKSIPEYLRKSYLYTSNATCEFCDPANELWEICECILNLKQAQQKDYTENHSKGQQRTACIGGLKGLFDKITSLNRIERSDPSDGVCHVNYDYGDDRGSSSDFANMSSDPPVSMALLILLVVFAFFSVALISFALKYKSPRRKFVTGPLNIESQGPSSHCVNSRRTVNSGNREEVRSLHDLIALQIAAQSQADSTFSMPPPTYEEAMNYPVITQNED